MSFLNLNFLQLFIVIYATYLLLGNRVLHQNLLLMLTSFLIYFSWDYRFAVILACSILINYTGSFLISKYLESPRRQIFLVTTISLNVLMLVFFKYFHSSYLVLCDRFHLTVAYLPTSNLAPLGISFYTFQAIGYLIELSRRKVKHESNLITFSLFISFFPQLMAGPIERALHFLPQLKTKRTISAEQIDSALYLIVLGYFKKMVVADNLALLVDQNFLHLISVKGLDLVITLLAFTLQIYTDFSGYTDLARGFSRLMGIELLRNFSLPYFSPNPAEFWKRWHISLSRWFHDYFYLPIGIKLFRIRPWLADLLLVTMFLLIGLWHGLEWKFVFFGLYHASLVLSYRFFTTHGSRLKSRFQSPIDLEPLKILFTFALISLGMVFFRAQNLDQIIYIFRNLSFVPSDSSIDFAYELIFYGFPFFLFEIIQFRTQNLYWPLNKNIVLRIIFFTFLIFSIIVFGNYKSNSFIYFEF